jgi:hypothetical protein
MIYLFVGIINVVERIALLLNFDALIVFLIHLVAVGFILLDAEFVR